MKLAIISHTQHYKKPDGSIVGWGPTITEINHLTAIFDEIYHVAVLTDEDPPNSALPYTSTQIHFIPIKEVGGTRLIDKFKILFQVPTVIQIVNKTLKKVYVFQLRTPTGMGVYLIPYLTLFSKKNGWFKYAGNWVEENPAWGFAIQRWLLKRQQKKATINGKWNEIIQPKQCITFENPCLTDSDRLVGLDIINNKIFEAPYTFCFAGRLEDAKGVRRIIEAFTNVFDKNKVKEVHLVGDGQNMDTYKKLAEKSGVAFIFHGFLSYLDVFEIYKKSHFFLLPSSASEGFPKVIAEAMNFGCIPIVSNVSSIIQYVENEKNGFIVSPNTSEKLTDILERVLINNPTMFYKMIHRNHNRTNLFTYEHYIDRIKKEIIEPLNLE